MILLGTITLTTSYGSSFDSGDRVLCYWDDSTLSIVVKREDNPGATLTVVTTGPNLGQLTRSQVSGVAIPRDPTGDRTDTRSLYEFCDGTTKVLFLFRLNFPAFPYFEKYDIEDHPDCAIDPVVCDIEFSGLATITPASSAYSNDAAAQVTATSSNPIRYTLSPSEFYADISYPPGDGRLTGNFTGLRTGYYTIYAVDSLNCKTWITVYIPIEKTYADKFTLQYYDVHKHVQTLLKIQEKGFLGSSVDVIAGGEPFTINKDANGSQDAINDKFDVMRPTFCKFSMVSERHFQYIGLFSQDDKKYKVVYSHNGISWAGFITPSVYDEEYSPSKNYTVNIVGSDKINHLNNLPFLDESNNVVEGLRTLIEILFICMDKTGLDFDIYSAVNRFADGMNTANTDDPLAQTYIDCASFYDDDGTPKTCFDVIQMLLKPFGAFIIQHNQAWWIVETEEQTSAYTYRRFSSPGTYVSNGTQDPLVLINRPSHTLSGAWFSDTRPTLTIVPAYGTIILTHNLRPKPNMLPPFPLWGGNLGNGGGSVANFVPINYGTGFALKLHNLDNENFATGYQNYSGNILCLTSFDVRGNTVDAIEINIDYSLQLKHFSTRTRGELPPEWVKIGWALQCNFGAITRYYSEVYGWYETAYDSRLWVNDIYEGTFNKKTNHTISVPNLPTEMVDFTDATFILKLYFGGTYSRDYSSSSGLKAIDTVDLPTGYRTKGLVSSMMSWYELRQGTDAESIPTIVRPNDYNAVTNDVQWYLTSGSTNGTSDKPGPGNVKQLLQDCYLYSANLKYKPAGEDPKTFEKLTLVNNPDFTESLEYEIDAGDIPKDFEAHQVYLNVFRLSDGTRTKNWTRKGFSEEKSIQELLVRNLVNQYAKPTWRLQSTFISDNLHFLNILKHTITGITYALTNAENPGSSGWSDLGAGDAWIYSSGHDTISFATGNDSLIRKQPVSNLVSGSRVKVEFSIARSNSNTSDPRIDTFYAIVLRNSVVVQKIALGSFQTDNVMTLELIFTIDTDGDEFGYMIGNDSGVGPCDYSLDYFRLTGIDTTRYYYSNSFNRSDKANAYDLELVQLIPAAASDTEDDTGGGNTGAQLQGGAQGRAHSGDFSVDYG